MSSESPPEGRPVRKKKKARPEGQPEAAPSSEASALEADPRPGPDRINPVILSLLTFFAIGFGVWLVSAGSRYRAEYAQSMEGWRVGSVRQVELTLVKDDKRNLACASDQVIAGLRCGYQSNQREAAPASADSAQLLQPYNTVGNELLLGAGLWTSPGMKGNLPRDRFSVVCNYNIKGVVRSVAIRFDPTASFGAVGKTTTVGTLSDCTIPR